MMVTIHNPSSSPPKKKRGKRRNPKHHEKKKGTMAKKKKHRRNPKRRRKAHRANPSPAPRKRHHGKARAKTRTVRVFVKNASRRKKRRRNPDLMPNLEKVGKAALAAVAAGTLVIAGVAIASKSSPAAAKYAYYGLGAAGALGGALLASKHPELGFGAAAGAIGAVALPITGAIVTAKLIAAPAAAQPSQPAKTTSGMGAVRQIQGLRTLDGVTYDDMRGVAYDDLGNPYDYDPTGAHASGSNPYG